MTDTIFKLLEFPNNSLSCIYRFPLSDALTRFHIHFRSKMPWHPCVGRLLIYVAYCTGKKCRQVYSCALFIHTYARTHAHIQTQSTIHNNSIIVIVTWYMAILFTEHLRWPDLCRWPYDDDLTIFVYASVGNEILAMGTLGGEFQGYIPLQVNFSDHSRLSGIKC